MRLRGLAMRDDVSGLVRGVEPRSASIRALLRCSLRERPEACPAARRAPGNNRSLTSGSLLDLDYCCRFRLASSRAIGAMMREAMLALLAKEPAHGYELRQRLAAALGPVGEVLNSGQVYVTLSRLERAGLVRG